MASKSSSGYKGVKMDDWIIVQTTDAFGVKVAQPLFEHGKFSTEKEAKAKLAKNKATITKSAGMYDSFKVEVMQFKQFTMLQREIYRENFGWLMIPRDIKADEIEQVKFFITKSTFFRNGVGGDKYPVSPVDDFSTIKKEISGVKVNVLWVRFQTPDYDKAKMIIENKFSPLLRFERATGDELDRSYIIYAVEADPRDSNQIMFPSISSVNPPEEIVDRPRLSFTEGEKIKKFIATNPLFKRNDDPVSMIDDFTRINKKINGEDVWVLWVRFTKPEYNDAKKIIEKEFPHVVFERAGDEFDLSYVMYLRATKKDNVGKKGNFTKMDWGGDDEDEEEEELFSDMEQVLKGSLNGKEFGVFKNKKGYYEIKWLESEDWYGETWGSFRVPYVDGPQTPAEWIESHYPSAKIHSKPAKNVGKKGAPHPKKNSFVVNLGLGKKMESEQRDWGYLTAEEKAELCRYCAGVLESDPDAEPCKLCGHLVPKGGVCRCDEDEEFWSTKQLMEDAESRGDPDGVLEGNFNDDGTLAAWQIPEGHASPLTGDDFLEKNVNLRLDHSHLPYKGIVATMRDIAKTTLNNKDFQKMIYTGEMQISLMQIPVHEDTGFESHKGIDQFFRIEKGRAFLVYGDLSYDVFKAGDAFVVPGGVRHNLVNATQIGETLNVYTIYSKPAHEPDYVSKDKPPIHASDLVGVPIGTQIQETLFKYTEVMQVGKYDYKTPDRVVFKDREARVKELDITAREIKGLIEAEVSMRKLGFEKHLPGFIAGIRKICDMEVGERLHLEEKMEGKSTVYECVGLGEQLFRIEVKHDDLIKEPSVRLALSMEIRQGNKWIKERPQFLMALSKFMDLYVHA